MKPRGPSDAPQPTSAVFVAKSLVAGGVAGSAAKTLIAPLDRIKILFQASNPRYRQYAGTYSGVFRAAGAIARERGLRGLFQGHYVTLARIFPYAAIKFMAYEQYKHWLRRPLLAGSLAGVTSVFATYPLDVVRVRMAYEVDYRPTVRGALRTIWSEPPPAVAALLLGPAAPIANFYRGLGPTVYGMIPYAGMSFWTYETLLVALQRPLFAALHVPRATHEGPDHAAPQLATWVRLCVGATAGALAQTLSYPFDIVRRRMQVAGTLHAPGGAVAHAHPPALIQGDQPEAYRNTWTTVRTVYRQSGWRGFFVGLSIGYLKVPPMAATSFVVYEWAKRQLGI